MIQFQNEHVTVFESQLFKTTSTVIQTDDCIIVVDPTWLPQEVAEIKHYVNKIKQSRPVYLLFTHSDWDHILGYGAFPNAVVIASEGLNERQDKQQILEQIREFDDRYYIDRGYPIVYPAIDVIVREDGQVFTIGKTSLTFYRADGHTDDGVFTIIEPLGVWITGDYLSDVEFPYIYFNSEKYEETLAKTDIILNKHEIRILVPGHGHVTESKEEIQQRKEKSLHYIKELRNAMQKNQESDHLIKKYSYLKGMKAFHEENMQIIKKELGK